HVISACTVARAPSVSRVIPPAPSSALFPYTTLFRSTVRYAGSSHTGYNFSARIMFQHHICQFTFHKIARVRVRQYYTVIAIYRRSEEHTSELQSREKPVCRLLLEKKNRRLDRRTGSR